MSTHAIQKIAQVESISTFLKRLKKKKRYKTVYINSNITIILWNNSFLCGQMTMILEQLLCFLSGWNKVIIFLILIYDSKDSSRLWTFSRSESEVVLAHSCFQVKHVFKCFARLRPDTCLNQNITPLNSVLLHLYVQYTWEENEAHMVLKKITAKCWTSVMD